MSENYRYVLLHSPLVGPLTWSLVADQMRGRGLPVTVPSLNDSPESNEPFWKQHTQSASEALAQISAEMPLILVAHSGAGPLLPAIRQSLPNPVRAYVFVDAGIPRDGATRLDMMMLEDPAWAAEFEAYLKSGGQFPNWNMDDLQEIIPDEPVRRRMVAEIQPRGSSFFTEPIPVFDGWPDAPCVYVKFSAPYNRPAAQARQAGWQTYEMEAGHFHMLVDAKAVADTIIEGANKI